MKRRILPALLSLVLLVCLGTVSVSARATSITPTLSFSNTTAQCSVQIRSPGKHIQATLELREGDKLLASWSDSGQGLLRLTGSHRVSHGETYTLAVHGSIGGNPFEGNAVSRKCP